MQLQNVGELANMARLTGLNAVKLIALIVKAASTTRMHKKKCRQLAQHLKLIGNLLDQLKITELKNYPEIRKPLEQLENILKLEKLWSSRGLRTLNIFHVEKY